jgi:hypothetical protein
VYQRASCWGFIRFPVSQNTHKTTQIASTIQSSESIKKVCDYTCASGMPPMSLGFRYDDE